MARVRLAVASDGRIPAATLTAVILLGCAREMPPPGARPDEVPPSILTIRPAPDSVVVGFDGQLELRFDEPVRVPNGIAREMFASPMEVYEAEIGFSNLRLRPEDGWRDGVTYCYSIPADGIADLLRNRMEGRAEFCFSTGADIAEGRVRGSLVDGLTGQPQRDARVIFWAEPDSIPYGAVTDSVGEFVTRGLPAGDYEAFGFVDRNRNLVPDRELESYDSVRVTALPDSLQELRFAVLPPDTTAPLLARAVMAGGEIVQLEFDDFLLNPQPGEPVIAIRESTANADLGIAGVLIGSADAVTFPSDSAAVDSAAVEGDSAAVADSAAVEPPVGDSVGAAADSTEEAPVLPSRFLTVRLEEPLDSATYLVSVSGVMNVRRLVGGGDTSFVAEPPPPPEDTIPAAADSVEAPGEPAPGDTLGAPPDTAGRRLPPGVEARRPNRPTARRRT
ncbi:Ig-like domain-containing protein [Candidatus Palauibacter sp.]|uniref:Ig-like domain-containing protein n=1 Tax=Candidatus Palauibacter sp. TaxID=3101350 RepID=UPI003B028CE9